MNRTLHIIHRDIGGVGAITKRLAEQGDSRIELASLKLTDVFKIIQYKKISFHQPFSHFIACLLFPLYFLRKVRISIILHEAADYDLSISKRSKKYIRRKIVNLCIIFGYEVRSVSQYISSTYGVKKSLVSYTQLFENDLSRITPIQNKYKSNALVWLRQGDAERALQYIKALEKIYKVKSIAILGNVNECQRILTLVVNEKINRKINIIGELSQEELLFVLSSIKWFITPYSREGFGLTAFQAMYYGAMVITPYAGALREWLPSDNFRLSNDILNAQQWTDLELIGLSEINTAHAKKMLQLSHEASTKDEFFY